MNCYFLSCIFFSYLKLLLSFLFLFFPRVHCYFLSFYFFSCYFFSYLKLLLSFLLPFFLSLSFRAPRYPPPWSFVTTPQGAVSQEHEWQTCCMRSKSHERLWPPLLKLKFGNIWTSKCCGSSCKKFNSGFQFQFQFQRFQFQFHFQFHQFQFQFQFQFRNWNWNWAAIPIPELNWPQPWRWCNCALSVLRTRDAPRSAVVFPPSVIKRPIDSPYEKKK